ncbi:MAG: lysine 5,6-aminomutase subunit alpha [Bacillus subtilis]|nr:lysine 5,6-aminomutase subunit alpha [Bacillus subtilis]
MEGPEPPAPPLPHRGHGQHLRGREAGRGRGRAGGRRHRRDPHDRAEPPRLRALRRDHRGLRRHLRHPGELPDHARRPRRGVPRGRSATSTSRTTPRASACPRSRPWAALERLDMMLNDSMYGILFRDINMYRTFVRPEVQPHDQRLGGRSSSTPARTTTSPPATPYEKAYTVLASQFLNERFAYRRRACPPGSWAWATPSRWTRPSRTASSTSWPRPRWPGRSSPSIP